MSQLFETEMHAPKVLFLSRFGSVVIFETPTPLTLQGEQAKRLQGRWSWWFLSLWVTQTYLLYTHFEWYQSHSTIWKSYLKSQIAHLRQRCQTDPAQKETTGNSPGSARSLVIGRSHTVRVSMLSWWICCCHQPMWTMKFRSCELYCQ